MKAKIKKTGEIVDVYHESQHGCVTNIYKEAVWVNARMWEEDELEFIIYSEKEELIDEIISLSKKVHDYVINTEHWLFYWIANKEVQDFIKEYPEDYEDMVDLEVGNITTSPSFVIKFEEHPYGIDRIERYAVLATFRDTVKARWLEYNGNIKEMQIKEKEKELAYHKNKITEIEKELEELK
jgi:hypothetical protein